MACEYRGRGILGCGRIGSSFWQAKGGKPLDGYRLYRQPYFFVGNLLKGG